jgi:hypothetical protein
LGQQFLEGNYYLHPSQSDDAILYDAEPEVYQLHIHKRNRNLPGLFPEIQDFVEHESVAYVQQLARYADMQDVDMRAR